MTATTTPRLLTPPNLVSLSRMALAPVMLALAYADAYGWFVGVLVVALVSDIVDGKLARWLGQTSEFGARLDSWADFATYTTVPLGVYWVKPDLFETEAIYFWLIVGSFIVPKLYGFLKFRKLTGYHTKGAVLAAYAVGIGTVVMLMDLAIWPFRLGAIFCVIPKLEEMAITTVLPRQVTNVPSLKRALELRRELRAERPDRSSARTPSSS